MYQLFLNWLRKRLGYHVCEEFTQWRKVEAQMEAVITRGGVVIGEPRRFIETYQVRECTLCGIQQNRLTDV